MRAPKCDPHVSVYNVIKALIRGLRFSLRLKSFEAQKLPFSSQPYPGRNNMASAAGEP